LDAETIQEVLDAYILVDQYCEALLMLGGRISDDMPSHRRVVLMPRERAGNVATLNRNMSGAIQRAIRRLA
jgi:hypothetical protein